MQKGQSVFFQLFLIAAALTLMIIATGNAQAEKSEYIVDVRVIKAEVLTIDIENRLLTLSGDNKIPVEVHVSEKIKNLDKIKVGDQVSIEYHESVAVSLGKPGSEPKEDLDVVVERSKEGESRGGRVLKTLDASALVKNIDNANRILTLEVQGGNMITTKVDESSKIFNSLKVGDTIKVYLTKNIAVSVETPEN